MTPQLVNYRVRRLWERGVIKRIHLYVDPRVYGLLPGIIVTKGKVDTPLIVWLSECLEGRVISYIAVPSYSCIDRLASELGDGLLVYRLSKDSGRTKKLSTFRPLADYLLKHPNAKISDISRALGISQRSASKKYRLALKYGAIKYVPIIDLSQADILLLSIITRVGITSIPIVRSRLLWSFNSEELHVGILYASNIREAKSIAERAEKLDPSNDGIG